jgi:hypothetical protein
MNNSTRIRRSWLGPRPGDFPLGSLESRAAARFVQLALDIEAQEQRAALLKNLTPFEQAFIKGVDDPRRQAVGLLLARAMVQKSERFGFPLPTPEEWRLKRRVPDEIAKIEQERAARGDTEFLNKEALREMAEDRLRQGGRSTAQPGSTTAEDAAGVD